MNFRRGVRREEPEINFIPLIDLLLVVLIFLMVTTSFSRFAELQVDLPSAAVDPAAQRPVEIVVAVSADSRYSIDGAGVAWRDPAGFAQALVRAAADRKEPTVVIHADAGASHQAVVNVLEAARLAGLGKVSFATQSGAGRKP
ncbi:MAG TPA: biopolymer transporter ExbD [Burkholderiaceae bacterium]|nr:biopolymer transporter ExbD [Burkholderiaceae bacterium]